MICREQIDLPEIKVRDIEQFVRRHAGGYVRDLQVLITNEEEVAVRGNSDSPLAEPLIHAALSELLPSDRLRVAIQTN